MGTRFGIREGDKAVKGIEVGLKEFLGVFGIALVGGGVGALDIDVALEVGYNYAGRTPNEARDKLLVFDIGVLGKAQGSRSVKVEQLSSEAHRAATAENRMASHVVLSRIDFKGIVLHRASHGKFSFCRDKAIDDGVGIEVAEGVQTPFASIGKKVVIAIDDLYKVAISKPHCEVAGCSLTGMGLAEETHVHSVPKLVDDGLGTDVRLIIYHNNLVVVARQSLTGEGIKATPDFCVVKVIGGDNVGKTHGIRAWGSGEREA